MTVVTRPAIEQARSSRVDSAAAQPIVERLQSVLRQIKRIVFLRGLLGVVAVAFSAILVLMGIDLLVVIESTLLRTVISLAGVGAVAWAAWWFIVRPLRRPLSLTTVARMIEAHHPELQERVSSAFELLSAPQGRGSRGSEQLIAALAAEASLDVRTFDPQREVATRSLRPYAVAACALASVFLGVLVLWPSQSANILLRLIAPGRNLDRVQALSLEVTPSGDQVVALGAPLTISVRTSNGRLTHPQLRHVDSTGREVRHDMQPVTASAGSDAFAYRYESVLESFQFQIQEGSALTRVYRITAVERPRIEQVRIQYEYPSYTALPGATQSDVTRPIVAPLGTKLHITAVCDRPIVKPTLHIGETAMAGQHGPAAKSPSYNWTLTINEGVALATLLVEDEHGIQSEPRVVELRSLADRPPQVRITDPSKDKIALKPTERLNLQYAVDEDFGLSGAALLVAIDGAAPVEQALPLPTTDTDPISSLTPGERRWQGRGPLDLSKFDLAKAKQVTVHVRVQDNRPAPAGAQVAVSPPLHITLDQTAASYPEQKINDQVTTFEKEVRKILTDLQAVQPVANELANKPGDPGKPNDQASAAAEQVTSTARDAATELLNTAAEFQNTLLQPLTPALTEVAQEPLKNVQQELNQAQVKNKPQERQEGAQAAAAEVNKAIAKLEAVLSKLPRHQANLNDLAKLENLRSQQEKVVAEIDHDAQQPPAPDAEQPWRKDEAAVAKELQDMSGKEPSPKEGMEGEGMEGEGEKGEGEKSGGMKPGMGGDSSEPSDKEGEGKGKGTSPGMGNPGAPVSSPPSAMARAASEASQAAGAPSAAHAQAPAASALQAIAEAASGKAQGIGVPSIASAAAPGASGPISPPGALGAKSAGPAGVVRHPDVRVGAGQGDWTAWHGRYNGNASDAGNADTPADFRDIVGRYFSAISQRGGGSGSEPTNATNGK